MVLVAQPKLAYQVVRVRSGVQMQAVSVAVAGLTNYCFQDFMFSPRNVLPINGFDLRTLAPAILQAAPFRQHMLGQPVVFVIAKCFADFKRPTVGTDGASDGTLLYAALIIVVACF